MSKTAALTLFSVMVLLFSSTAATPHAPAAKYNWLRSARIASPDDVWTEMTDRQISAFLARLAAEHVNAVNLDVSYDDEKAQTAFLERAVRIARSEQPRMRLFAYQAPLEIVSPRVDMDRDGAVDPGKQSAFSRHPEWAQRGLRGEPAVIYGVDTEDFWVGRFDEDMWLCPNDSEYAGVWREHLAQVAATGVDGVYIDVPFLRGWFDDRRGWRWACACEDCAAKYFDDFASPLPRSEDWGDANFRRFVSWRFTQIEEFIAEIRAAVREGNPGAAVIVEHWDGVGNLVETGCDPLALAAVSDVRAHEWAAVSGSASDYQRYTWMEEAVRLLFYRAADGGQPSWLLTYADSGDTAAMRSLAASTLVGNHNFWETDAPDMAGSVNHAARTAVFGWIGDNADLLYPRRVQPDASIGLFYPRNSVVFSDALVERGFGPSAEEFFGVGMLLLANHATFIVVTDLNERPQVDTLIVPHALCLSDDEASMMAEFVRMGGTVIATGRTGALTADGRKRRSNALADINSHPRFHRVRRTFGRFYRAAAKPYQKAEGDRERAAELERKFAWKVLRKSDIAPGVVTNAPPSVMITRWRGGEVTQLRLFDAAAAGDVGVERSISIELDLPAGQNVKSLTVLPFWGNRYVPESWRATDSGGVSFELVFSRAAVIEIRQ